MTPAAVVSTAQPADDAPAAGYLHICAAEYFPKRQIQRENCDAATEIPFKLLNGESIDFLCKLQASTKNAGGGLVALSNYRLFVQSAVGIANVPVRMIDSVEFAEQKRLHVWCKQCSNIRIEFDSVEQCIEWHKRLSRLPEGPSKLEELFAFAFYAWRTEECSSSNNNSTNLLRQHQILHASSEAFRTLSNSGYDFDLEREARRLGFRLGTTWRLSDLNIRYEVSATYPKLHIVPANIDDTTLKRVAVYRSGGRFPSIAWRHPHSGAILARSSQPEVGWLGWRCVEDEQLISAFCAAVQADRLNASSSNSHTEDDDNDADDRRKRHYRGGHRSYAKGELFLPSNGIISAACSNSSCYDNGVRHQNTRRIDGTRRNYNGPTPRNCSPSCDAASLSTVSGKKSSAVTLNQPPQPIAHAAATPSGSTRRMAPPPPDLHATSNGTARDGSVSVTDAGASCCTTINADLSNSTLTTAVDSNSVPVLPFSTNEQPSEIDPAMPVVNNGTSTIAPPSTVNSTVGTASSTSNKALLIIDARSYSAAMANRVKGGGVEMLEYYTDCDIQFMGLGNIHVLRKSLITLRQLILCYPDGAWLPSLEATKWLSHVAQILKSALVVVKTLATEQRSCMVHCTDGWDRTPLIIALAMVMMDPHFRTIRGFQQLIERQWVQFGHKFADRCGHNVKTDYNEISPIFLVWLDCIWQLVHQFPCDFEFNEAYLIQLAHHAYSCLFGTFLCNSACERDRISLNDRTYSLWAYMERHADENFSNLLFVKRNVVLWPNSNQQDLLLWTRVYYPHSNPLTASFYRQNLLRPPTAPAAAAAVVPTPTNRTSAVPTVNSSVCRPANNENLTKNSKLLENSGVQGQKSHNVMTRSGDYTLNLLPKARSCEDIMCMSAIQPATTSSNRINEVVSPPLFLPPTVTTSKAEILEIASENATKSDETIVAGPSSELSASIFMDKSAENLPISSVSSENLAKISENLAENLPTVEKAASTTQVPSEDSATNAVEASPSAVNQAGTFEDVAAAAAAAAVASGAEKVASEPHIHVPNSEQQQIEAAQVMIMLNNSSSENVAAACATDPTEAAVVASQLVMENVLNKSTNEPICNSDEIDGVKNERSDETTTTPVNNVMSESLLRSAIFTGSSDFDGCGEDACDGVVSMPQTSSPTILNGHAGGPSSSRTHEIGNKQRSGGQTSESSESLPSNSSLTDGEDEENDKIAATYGTSSSSSSSSSSSAPSFVSSSTARKTRTRSGRKIPDSSDAKNDADTAKAAALLREAAHSTTPSQLRKNLDVTDEAKPLRTRPRSNTAGALSMSPAPPPPSSEDAHANGRIEHTEACANRHRTSTESIDSDTTCRMAADDYYDGNENYNYNDDYDDEILEMSGNQCIITGGSAGAITADRMSTKLGEDGLFMLRNDDQRRLRGIREYYIRKLDKYRTKLHRAQNAAARHYQQQQQSRAEQSNARPFGGAPASTLSLTATNYQNGTLNPCVPNSNVRCQMPFMPTSSMFTATCSSTTVVPNSINNASPATSSANLPQLSFPTLQQQRRSTPSGSSSNSASNLSNGSGIIAANGSPCFSSWGAPTSSAAPVTIAGRRDRRPSTTTNGIEQHYGTSADSSYSICSWDQVVLVENSNNAVNISNSSEHAHLQHQSSSNSNELQHVQQPSTNSVFNVSPVIGGVSGVGGFMHSSVFAGGAGTNMPSSRSKNRSGNVRNFSGENRNTGEITASQYNFSHNSNESSTQNVAPQQQLPSNGRAHHANFHRYHSHHHHHHSHHNNTDELDGRLSNDAASRPWIPDHAATSCYACKCKFWLGKRKHHCRKCGRVFCSACSDYQCPLPEESEYQPVRVCRSCYIAAQHNSNSNGGVAGRGRIGNGSCTAGRKAQSIERENYFSSTTTCAQQQNNFLNETENKNTGPSSSNTDAGGGYYRKAIRAGGGAVLKGLYRGFPRGILRS